MELNYELARQLHSDGKHAELMSHLRKDWGPALERLIPQRMHSCVTGWIFFGWHDEDFLNAIVSHELFNAYRYADDGNQPIIGKYVEFFYMYAPSPCHGQGWQQWKGIFPEQADAT